MKITLNRFDGGITNDPRDTSPGVARVVTNFDIITKQGSLIPYRSSESGDTAASTSKKQNFCIALYLPGSTNLYRLFSLGVKTGTGTGEVLMKDLTTTSSDLSDGTWLTPSANQSAAATNFNLFVYYKKTGLIYSAAASTTIETFDPTAGAAWNSASHALAYTNVAQGVVHSKDDILYIPYDNKIAANNNGVWTDAALTLPNNLYITSICEYNNYLAIGCASLSGVGNSRVFLWDRSSTIATISENIDWGTGNIKVLEEIGGYLIGISVFGGSTTVFTDRVSFKYYTGSGSVQFKEILGTSSTVLSIAKQKINNRIHFLMSVNLNGTIRDGVWSFGKNNAGVFNLIHERTPNNDTALVNGVLNGFFYVGDFLFIAYQTSSAFALSKTSETSGTYSHTSIMESQINPGMPAVDRMYQKQLKSVAVTYSALPAAGQCVLKYKVDGGSYTTIFTETTDNAVFTERFDASGVPFTFGRDYEFRIESTGGAEITGLIYEYIINPTNI